MNPMSVSTSPSPCVVASVDETTTPKSAVKTISTGPGAPAALPFLSRPPAADHAAGRMARATGIATMNAAAAWRDSVQAKNPVSDAPILAIAAANAMTRNVVAGQLDGPALWNVRPVNQLVTQPAKHPVECR